MHTTIADRCTSLIGRARAVLSRHPLIPRKGMDRRRPRRMALLDLELYPNDIHG